MSGCIAPWDMWLNDIKLIGWHKKIFTQRDLKLEKAHELLKTLQKKARILARENTGA